jgi:hypothetical protein
MTSRPLRTVAVASARTLGTAVAAVTSAGAATAPTAPLRPRSPRTATPAPHVAVASARSARTISDGAFSVTRYVTTSDGTRRVVFVARNLRTGAVLELTEGDRGRAGPRVSSPYRVLDDAAGTSSRR